MKKYKSQIDKEELIIFARQLALIINSQITLHDGLTLIQKKSNNEGLKNILSDVIVSIDQESTLSEALKKHEEALTPFFINMVEIGETSGNLVNVLEQIGDGLEKELETTQKVKSAISYPIILSILMFGVVVLLVVQILPMFSEVLISLGGTMPVMTQVILDISNFIGSNLYLMILMIIVIVFLLSIYRKTEKGIIFFDQLKFVIPVQREIVSALTATRFARNLSILIKSGVDITKALIMMKPIMNNTYVERKIDDAIKHLDEGESFDHIIENLNLFPWVLIKLISVAQTTGHLDVVLDKAAVVMEQETDLRLKRLTTVIEPMLILILSIIVGVILVSVVLPVVNIMNSIG